MMSWEVGTCAVWRVAGGRHLLPSGLAAIAVLLVCAHAWAQALPTVNRPGAGVRTCHAEVVYDWNLGSIPRDSVEWEMRRGAAGQAPSVQTAELVARGFLPGSREAMRHDLRAYGPVLNGTPYLFRIRAVKDGTPTSEWSTPHIHGLAYASDGMFSTSFAGSPAEPAIDLSWALGGRLPACADRIWYEVKKGGPATSSTAPDPGAYMGWNAAGTSGSQLLPLSGQGPGDYYVRIVARHGGDTPRHDVGTWAQSLKVTVPPVIHAVRVRAVERNACTNRDHPLVGAAVRVSASGSTAELGTTNASGEARFSLPAGAYAVTVGHPACSGNGSGSLSVSEDTDLDVTVPDCASPEADLAVGLSGAPSPPGGQPYSLTATVTVVSSNGPSRSGTIVVNRREEGTGTTVLLLREAVPPLCPGASRQYEFADPDPEAGKTYTYMARLEVADAESGNNLATRQTTFAYVAVAAIVANPSPPSVSIASFAIRGGLPFVRVNRRVLLNATASGAPTEFRAAELSSRGSCQRSLARVRWQPWSATNPLSWTFSRLGSRKICFQLRRGGDGETSSIMEDDITVVPLRWQSGLLGSTHTPLGAPAILPSFNSLSCGSKFAVGLDVRNNHLVDAVALRCANLGPRWEHSNASSTEFVGGAGGYKRELHCRDGEVLAAVKVRYGLYIDQIRVACRAWPQDAETGGRLDWRHDWMGGGGGDKDAEAACPAPLAIRGLPELHKRGSILPFGTPILAAFDVLCELPGDQ